MALFHPHRLALAFAIAIACVYAEKHAASIASMSISEIEDKLQVSYKLPPARASTNPSQGMPSCSRSQYVQARNFSANLDTYLAHLCCSLSGIASSKCAPRDALHIWAT